MNKILVGEARPQNLDKKTFFVELSQASDILAILKSDHFLECSIHTEKEITNSQLRFTMHLTRILNDDGVVIVKGSQKSITKSKTILKNLNLFLQIDEANNLKFLKKQKKLPDRPKVQKLSIGFKSIQEQRIDEDELLKNQKIDLTKAAESCADKPRACANCNCGRKEQEAQLSKEELVKSINEGKLVSGCGKCSLGDSFRCATCPYAGLPAFKPGDKLRLVDNEKVIVQSSQTKIEEGKVKLEI